MFLRRLTSFQAQIFHRSFILWSETIPAPSKEYSLVATQEWWFTKDPFLIFSPLYIDLQLRSKLKMPSSGMWRSVD